MEDSEKRIILNASVKLLTEITCSPEFLKFLRQDGIISASEESTLAQEILRGHGSSGQVNRLLEIIETRVGAFRSLIKALEGTNQTGAVKLLTGSSGTIVTRQIIVGEPECSINSVVRVITSSESHKIFITNNWKDVARQLDIGQSITRQYEQDILLRVRDAVDVFQDMLSIWRNAKSSNATLEALTTAFRNSNSNSIADALQSQFTT